MSENKPNDEPKLSTTDRVVKCKCNLSCHTETRRYHTALSLWPAEADSRSQQQPAATAATAAANVAENCLLATEEEGC